MEEPGTAAFVNLFHNSYWIPDAIGYALFLVFLKVAKISLVIGMSNEGSVETNINCTKLIKTLLEEEDFQVEIVSSHSLLVALMRLVKDKRHPSMNLQVRFLIVSIGTVR
ncbi:hypothetical protein L1887_21850 [Cichorium endivia]|nr:hypothetical protein L1887_21850 [Cichorium endivia]